MRGKVLSRLIEEDRLRLPPRVHVDDLETMLRLLLASRGVTTLEQLSDVEETFALWAICRWSFPLKPPSYAVEASTLLSHFRGISASPSLQGKFRARISPWYVSANAAAELQRDRAAISTIFKVLRRNGPQSLKRRARVYRNEVLVAA